MNDKHFIPEKIHILPLPSLKRRRKKNPDQHGVSQTQHGFFTLKGLKSNGNTGIIHDVDK